MLTLVLVTVNAGTTPAFILVQCNKGVLRCLKPVVNVSARGEHNLAVGPNIALYYSLSRGVLEAGTHRAQHPAGDLSFPVLWHKSRLFTETRLPRSVLLTVQTEQAGLYRLSICLITFGIFMLP